MERNSTLPTRAALAAAAGVLALCALSCCGPKYGSHPTGGGDMPPPEADASHPNGGGDRPPPPPDADDRDDG